MNVKKIASNAKWIVVCKVAQSLLQLMIGILSARYLGPENYGLINYAKSVVAFAVPFTQLGLSEVLVRELIETPEREGEILGTSLLMSFFSSLVCIISVWSFVSVINRGEVQTIYVCVLYSLSLIFLSVELIQYWFHSKLKSKYPSIMMLVSYVVVSAYKIFLLVTQKNVYWFAVVYSLEFGIIGLSLLIIYFHQADQNLSVSWGISKRLLSNSYPYIFSSLMVTLFQNTDHVMLKMIVGNTENGFYSAAITCATVCSFFYAAITDSLRPAILASKKEGSENYSKYISTLYCIIIYLALLQGCAYILLAKPLVWILYGSEYMQAAPILRILVWYIAFSQMGVIRNIWILAEGKQRYLWRINLTGALVNILINALLIPIWGAFGAAFASFMTQAFTNFVLGFLIEDIRENNRLLMKGLNPRFLIELIHTGVNLYIKK